MFATTVLWRISSWVSGWLNELWSVCACMLNLYIMVTATLISKYLKIWQIFHSWLSKQYFTSVNINCYAEAWNTSKGGMQTGLKDWIWGMLRLQYSNVQCFSLPLFHVVWVRVPDGLVVKTSISLTWTVLSMIWRSWVRTLVWSNLGCVILLSKSYLNQNCKLQILKLF